MIVKICGLTNVADALAALDAGADCLGFVMYPPSPRGLNEDQLFDITAALPTETRRVGVFVNETPETVARVAARCGLYAVQIHGDESPAGFAALPCTVWRAVRWKGSGWVPAPEQWPAERYVVDAASPQYGGSGALADWTAAQAMARRYRVMLAGGLGPDNVADAVRRVRPLGVDVSSGVEQVPGRKDTVKMQDFVRRARQAAAS